MNTSTHLPDCFDCWVTFWESVKHHESTPSFEIAQSVRSDKGLSIYRYELRFIKEKAFQELLSQRNEPTVLEPSELRYIMRNIEKTCIQDGLFQLREKLEKMYVDETNRRQRKKPSGLF